jgi:hypothetical protein
MPIDASIYGQIQQPKEQNPLNALAQAYQIKAYQSTIDKSDRAEQQQNRLLSVLQSPEFQQGDAATKQRLAYGAGDVDAATKIGTASAAANKDQREAEKAELAMAIDRYQQSSGGFAEIAKNPAAAQQILGHMVQAKIMDPAYAQKVLASASQAPDPAQFWMQGAQAAVSAKDKLTLQLQQQGQAVTMRGQDLTAQTSRANNADTVGATMRGQDMADARSREANTSGRIPSGYRQTADGTLEFIPGGPADPAAAKRAAPTEFQGKSAIFGSRAQEADRILSGLGTDFSSAGINAKNAVGGTPLIGGALEAGANVLLSDNSQKAEQAQRDFVNAVLRLESGAAIGKDEFNNAKKQYFPQPGDSAEVIAQKAANRKLQIQGLLGNAGNAPIPKAPAAAGPMKVTNAADYANVPSGATYVTPDGKTRRKP